MSLVSRESAASEGMNMVQDGGHRGRGNLAPGARGERGGKPGGTIQERADLGQDGRVPALRYRRASMLDEPGLATEQVTETEAAIAGLGLSLDPSHDYLDEPGGLSLNPNLPARERLLREAEAGRLRGRVLVVWALDRLARDSFIELVRVLRTLLRGGVNVVSCREPWASADLLPDLVAWLSRWDSSRRSERSRGAHLRDLEAAGESRVRRGRKPCVFNEERARELRAQGRTWKEIAGKLQIAVGSLHERLQGRKTPRAGRGGCNQEVHEAGQA